MDPEMGFEQHLRVLEEFLQNRGTRDLLKCLAPIADIRWSHAPKLRDIVGFADLLMIVLNFSHVAKLNHKFLVRAALAMHQSDAGAILFGMASIGTELLAATSSYRIRCVLSKFRDLDKDPSVYPRMMHEVVKNITKHYEPKYFDYKKH